MPILSRMLVDCQRVGVQQETDDTNVQDGDQPKPLVPLIQARFIFLLHTCLLADETSSCRSMSHSSATNPSTTVVELPHLTSVCLGCATSTTTGVSYMELVPDRWAQTLISIIERIVRHGAIIQRPVGCLPRMSLIP